jgi:formylmethanofuran dehydrogenase subunit B
VDVGAAASTAADVDRRFVVSAQDEIAVLVALQGLLREPTPASVSLAPADGGPAWSTARELATELASGRYVAVVFDAEADDREPRSRQRFDALVGLSHVLNQRSRCAAVALRGGGNRSGADAVLTSQTGYPLGIDFSRGYPRYRPLARGAVAPDVAVVIGDPSLLTPSEIDGFRGAAVIVIGPSASRSSLGVTSVAIDTGVAGIHESGSAVRADDVPLRLRASLPSLVSAVDVIRALSGRVLADARLRSTNPPAVTP